MKPKRVTIVGAGIGGLSLGALLARQGAHVKILEKNAEPGGRARVFRRDGYAFDMGPTWYLMPEVFERFFQIFGRRREDAYDLMPLDPSYRVLFEGGAALDVPRDPAEIEALFETMEQGGARKLRSYLDDARHKYGAALDRFLYRDYTSVFQFLNRGMIAEGSRLNLFRSLERHTARYFHDRRARQLLEYHMVFLGSSPARAPALYSLMSHADLNLGVFYPKRQGGRGGMAAIVDALVELCTYLGVEILTDSEVDRLEVKGDRFRAAHLAGGGEVEGDLAVVNADYAYAETHLLAPAQRSYSERYWRSRQIAPSMYLLYLGLDRRLAGLAHHTLYFAEDWSIHFRAITDRPSWPDRPCFYLCAPSRTDPSVAPAGCESLYLLVPIASGLPDGPDIRAAYREHLLDHVEGVTGESIRKAVRFERSFSVSDFVSSYNAFRGTALGLAHTLRQTALFRPSHRSRRVSNLWYSGCYTHPGVGVPMTIISSQIVAERIGRADD